jgi:hypothetical protein
VNLLSITPPEEAQEKKARRSRYQPKGRIFRVVKLAHVVADGLWEGGSASTEVTRPIWLKVAGTETELRPFLANIRKGRKAELEVRGHVARNPERFELLKSGGYLYTWQRGLDAAGACAVSAYLPELFLLDPGMVDPAGVKFVCLTPRWWADAEDQRLAADTELCTRLWGHWRALSRITGDDAAVPPGFELTIEDVVCLIPQAARFAAYLDRRTRRPIVQRPEFHLQLYLAALYHRIATLAVASERDLYHRDDDKDSWAWARHDRSFVEVDTAEVGLLPGVACRVDHPTLDSFLAAQVRLFFRIEQETR